MRFLRIIYRWLLDSDGGDAMHIVFKAVRAMPSVSLLFALSSGLIGCHSNMPEPTGASINLRSASFGSQIPARFSSCAGKENVSPSLSWDTPPSGAQSLVLMAYDEDSPFATNFVHWLVFNLPPTTTSLSEGISSHRGLPDGARQGRNGSGGIGYTGPCPPGRSPHHYVFNLYVLDTSLDLPAASSKDQLIKAMAGHVIAGGQLKTAYQR